ncbi:MAG: CD225/dispanin family protein [Prevotellaceae bacterium]|nr:CD225/dispanin family protein [Prevotellaceae bacterium]
MENLEEMMPPKPENYLVWAILSTVCCCLPFGIVSIVYAAKVDSLYTSKQYEAALEASGKAKRWALIAAGSGVAVGIIYGLLSVSSAALLGGLS